MWDRINRLKKQLVGLSAAGTSGVGLSDVASTVGNGGTTTSIGPPPATSGIPTFDTGRGGFDMNTSISVIGSGVRQTSATSSGLSGLPPLGGALSSGFLPSVTVIVRNTLVILIVSLTVT